MTAVLSKYDAIPSLFRSNGKGVNHTYMLSGSQIRAGRALLGWSARTLAEQSGVSESTIRRAEAVDGTPRMRADNLLALQRAMEGGGCLFLDAGDNRHGGDGVRWRRPLSATDP